MDYSFCEATKGGWEAWTSEVGCSQPAALLDFLSPLQVVRPGLLSRNTLDQILQVLPETQLLQRVVQPTCSDAEVRLMRRDVMDAVVLAGEDDLAVLEEHNPTRQAKVRVRPLVNLVGQGHKDGQCEQVAVPGVVTVNLHRGKGEEVEGHVC